MNEERKFSINEIEEILDKVVASVISTVELASTVASDTPRPLINAVVGMNKETANEVKNETLLLLRQKIKSEETKKDINSIFKSMFKE